LDAASTLRDVLDRRQVRRETLYQAARYYVADRLGDPGVSDLRSDLRQLMDGADEVVAMVSADGRLLQDLSLAVLTAAWAEPGERDRVLRAVDASGGKLPVADPLLLTVMSLYGLYQVVSAGHRLEETTTIDQDGRYVTRRVDERGAIALFRDLFRGAPGEPATTDQAGPDDAHVSIALLDIQGSTSLRQAERLAAVSWLRSTLDTALMGLGLDPADPRLLQIRERGDGYQVVAPERRIGLTRIVNDLPPLLAGPLAARPRPEHADGPLRVRLALHTDLLLHKDYGWDGQGLSDIARMIEVDEVKDLLRDAPERLATVLSARAHYSTVWRGYGTRDDYRRIPARINGADTHVWVVLS
jgi:hypothetical protein